MIFTQGCSQMTFESIAKTARRLPTNIAPIPFEIFTKKIKHGYCYVFYTPDHSCSQYMMVERWPDEDAPIRIPYSLSREIFERYKKVYDEELCTTNTSSDF